MRVWHVEAVNLWCESFVRLVGNKMTNAAFHTYLVAALRGVRDTLDSMMPSKMAREDRYKHISPWSRKTWLGDGMVVVYAGSTSMLTVYFTN